LEPQQLPPRHTRLLHWLEEEHDLPSDFPPTTPVGKQASTTSTRKTLTPHLFLCTAILNAKKTHMSHFIREEQ
jgi:hypothetical protein